MQLTDHTSEYKDLQISSIAFESMQRIPTRYTCDGKDISPPLSIADIPEKAVSLALIVDDPDAGKKSWVHWLVWNIPITHHIEENKIPGEQGMNDFEQKGYGGPCPPSGTHRYFFKVYALDTLLHLGPYTDKSMLEKAMQENILAYGELIGVYSRTGL